MTKTTRNPVIDVSEPSPLAEPIVPADREGPAGAAVQGQDLSEAEFSALVKVFAMPPARMSTVLREAFERVKTGVSAVTNPADTSAPAQARDRVEDMEGPAVPSGEDALPLPKQATVEATDPPVEYATQRWEVCHPPLGVVPSTSACPDTPEVCLLCNQFDVWTREGMPTVWARVLVNMLWQAGPSLDSGINITQLASRLNRNADFIRRDVVGSMCEFGMIQRIPGTGGTPRVFRFARHADMVRLIRQKRDFWLYMKTMWREA